MFILLPKMQLIKVFNMLIETEDRKKEILSIAKSCKSKFIYASSASVYGLNEDSEEIRANEAPLNIYAESKLLFDQYIMAQDYPAVGLRYFNVYGRGEENKGKMASMAYKMNEEYVQSKKISLFKGTGGYKNGEQKRDFVHVYDIVEGLKKIAFSDLHHDDAWELGTGISYSINNLFQFFKERFNVNHISISDQPGNYRKTLRENDDTLKLLNWSPKDRLEEHINNIKI